jgi:hypothetical protein
MYGVTADGVGATISGGRASRRIKPTAAAMETTGACDVDVERAWRILALRARAAGAPGPRPGQAHAVSCSRSCELPDRRRLPRALRPARPPELVETLLDYLAKDYASFRRALVDLLPTLKP